MIESSDVGKELVIQGERVLVLDFSKILFTDPRCESPNVSIATIEILDSGEILEINWED